MALSPGSRLGSYEVTALIGQGCVPTLVEKEKWRNLTMVAALMSEEEVIGWFQGRMEFGPRALGSRSIIGDATSSSSLAPTLLAPN